MTPGLSRAARALLGWSQADLAVAAAVAVRTVATYEREEQKIHDNSIEAIRRALEVAGIVMLDEKRGIGVLLRKTPTPKKTTRAR
jgi:transcriptional regulator with XRE-family HTH domain